MPLNFNKLDMRDYLQRLYGVGVVSVRSFVEQQKLTRLKSLGRYGYGKIRRPQSKKKMTVEMKEAFVWPEAPTDMAPYVTLSMYLFDIVVVVIVVEGLVGCGNNADYMGVCVQMGEGPVLQGSEIPGGDPG